MRILRALALSSLLTAFGVTAVSSQGISERVAIEGTFESGFGYDMAKVVCADGSGGVVIFSDSIQQTSCASFIETRYLNFALMIEAARNDQVEEPRTGAMRILSQVVGTPPVRLSVFSAPGRCIFVLSNAPSNPPVSADTLRERVRIRGGLSDFPQSALAIVDAIDAAPDPCRGAAMQRGRASILGHGAPGLLALYVAREYRLRRGGWISPLVFETPSELTGNQTFYNVVLRGRPPEKTTNMQEFFVVPRSQTAGFEGLLADLKSMAGVRDAPTGPMVQQKGAPRAGTGSAATPSPRPPNAVSSSGAQANQKAQSTSPGQVGATTGSGYPHWMAGRPIDMEPLRRWLGADCTVLGDGLTGSTFISGMCRRMQLSSRDSALPGCPLLSVDLQRNTVYVEQCRARDPRGVVNDNELNTKGACAIVDWGDQVTCGN